jgi:hypothetical protein
MAAAPVSAAPSSCALAEEATDGLDSWPKVYRAYQKFQGCDDGGVAEGYADKIEELLAAHWSDVGVLINLAKSDPKFESFVLRHLGEITTLPNAQAIVRHAQDSCTEDALAFCAKLVAQLDVAGLPKWRLRPNWASRTSSGVWRMSAAGREPPVVNAEPCARSCVDGSSAHGHVQTVKAAAKISSKRSRAPK